MKVLFISHYTGLYGANKSLLEVMINLRDKYNVKPIVLTPGFGELNQQLIINNIESYSYNYYNWIDFEGANKVKYFYRMFRYKICNFITIKKVLKELNKLHIDLIHTNSSVCDFGAILARKMNINHIWHIREFGKEDYNLVFYKKKKDACKFMYNNSNYIICISKAIKDYYSKYFPNDDKFKLVYNGVSEKKYYKNISKKNFDDKFNIIFTGVITQKKNQMELVKAIDILINKKKLKNINVYFLGDGDENYIGYIQEFINKNNLERNIFMEGKVDNIQEYIEKSHVGVICSEKEAFGRVTIEYMLGGLAVIASNTGANIELINNNQTGLLYELGNYKNLSEKIEELYNDRDKLLQFASHAQKEALSKFTSYINTYNLYNIYKETMNSCD